MMPLCLYQGHEHPPGWNDLTNTRNAGVLHHVREAQHKRTQVVVKQFSSHCLAKMTEGFQKQSKRLCNEIGFFVQHGLCVLKNRNSTEFVLISII